MLSIRTKQLGYFVRINSIHIYVYKVDNDSIGPLHEWKLHFVQICRVRKIHYGHYLEEGPLITMETHMPHPSHANHLLSCEKGLHSGMLLFGGRLTTSLDFANM